MALSYRVPSALNDKTKLVTFHGKQGTDGCRKTIKNKEKSKKREGEESRKLSMTTGEKEQKKFFSLSLPTLSCAYFFSPLRSKRVGDPHTAGRKW